MKTLISLSILFLPFLTLAQNKDNLSKVVKMQCKVSGQGRPIVLVPGGLTGWASWEPFEKIFAAKNTVVRVQLLGVQLGLENRPLPDDYSVIKESQALAATLDSLGLTSQVDVVAWSFGAFTALDFALSHPERIRTLTLIEPPAMWVLRVTGRWDEDAQRNADFFMRFHSDITEDLLGEFLEKAGFVKPGQSPRELQQWNYWLPFRRSLRINPYVVSRHDNVMRLKNFKAPVFLVKGTGSTPWLHHIIDGLAESFPNVQVAEFPGGHAPHIVSKDRFLPALEQFQSLKK